MMDKVMSLITRSLHRLSGSWTDKFLWYVVGFGNLEHDLWRSVCICLWWRKRHGKRRSQISPHHSSRTGSDETPKILEDINLNLSGEGSYLCFVIVFRDQWILQKQRALWRICKWVEDILEMYGNERPHPPTLRRSLCTCTEMPQHDDH